MDAVLRLFRYNRKQDNNIDVEREFFVVLTATENYTFDFVFLETPNVLEKMKMFVHFTYPVKVTDS